MSIIIAHLQQGEESKTKGRFRLLLDLQVLILGLLGYSITLVLNFIK